MVEQAQEEPNATLELIKKSALGTLTVFKDEPLFSEDEFDRTSDAFNHAAFAETILKLIKQNEPPLSIGLFGAWGIGKSTIINILFKKIAQQESGSLKPMGIAGVPNAEASFEFQPSPTEGTCIDFSMLLRSGGRVNFEIKYTESEFGSAKADPAHLDKFESIYKSRLAERFEESFCCAAQFLENYQIARNVWHLNESAGDIAIFLFPNENTRLRKYEALIKGCALEPFRSRIRVVYLEDLILNLFKELNPNETAGRLHLEEFRAKYLPFVKMAR